MNAFDHFTVFFSIIIGLTVTRLLSGFAELIRNGRTVQWDIGFAVWSLLVLLSSAYEWWVIQRWQRIESVQFFAFLFISIWQVTLAGALIIRLALVVAFV